MNPLDPVPAGPTLTGVRTVLEAELASLAQSAQFGCFR